MSDLLKNIAALSHEFGTPEFVKGGGGNTSVKNAGTLWIKPSGTTLAGLQENDFVAVDRKALSALYAMDVPPDAAVREARVKDVMMAAVCGGSRGRPSVETPLHDIFHATYVVHTHAVLVNGMTCGHHGRTEAARLFPDALWLPYIDPGFTLSMAVRAAVADYEQTHGRQPSVILLENHGIFVAGNTPDEVRACYGQVMKKLENVYTKAAVSRDLKFGAPPDAAEIARVRDLLQASLGADAAAVEVSAPFSFAEGPLTPDHIVYAKAFPFCAELSASALAAFVTKHGYAPRIVATSSGVFAPGRTVAKAKLALELTLDGGLVKQLTQAFGGVRYLDDAARSFIEAWEVESYREQMLSKSKG